MAEYLLTGIKDLMILFMTSEYFWRNKDPHQKAAQEIFEHRTYENCKLVVSFVFIFLFF